MAVYIVNRKHELASVSDRYFGGNEIHMNYAFNYGDRIAQGFSGNGFVVSLEEQNTDTKLHGFVRHQIGHILFSCWIETNGFEDHCPRWAWIGAAHFLMKLLPPQKNYATYCFGESAGGEGSGKKWPKRVRDMAKRALSPIETFFNKNSLSDFDYKDHLRAWSMMTWGCVKTGRAGSSSYACCAVAATKALPSRTRSGSRPSSITSAGWSASPASGGASGPSPRRTARTPTTPRAASGRRSARP